jgi:hypothetical protein
LALLKKQEEICLALGNKSSLGYCYWNWGLVERAPNHPEREKEKLAALTIFEELQRPANEAPSKPRSSETSRQVRERYRSQNFKKNLRSPISLAINHLHILTRPASDQRKPGKA